MKKLILTNLLVSSALILGAQNIINEQTASNINVNQTNWDNNPYDNIGGNEIQTNNRGNRGGGASAFQSLSNNNNNATQTQAANSNNRSTQRVQGNVYRGNTFNTNINDVNDNVQENNSPNRGNQGPVNNVAANSNPQANTSNANKSNNTKVVVAESGGLDFKPITRRGGDYSDGGKMKKGQKNFYSQQSPSKKTVSKRKPSFKKVKHHTSKCASW